MKIVHITNTDPAGSVINFVNATNRHTEHNARLITTEKNGYQFPGDIDFLADAGEEIEALLIQADVFHLHKVQEDEMRIPIKLRRSGVDKEYTIQDFVNVDGRTKKVVYHLHGHPYERENVAENGGRYAEKLAAHPGRRILASTPDLQTMYDPKVPVTYFPNCVPERDPKYLPRATDEAILSTNGERKYAVFQAPTNAILKDVRIIEEAIVRLKDTIPVFYYQVTGCPQVQMLTLKRAAHIIFDHMQGYYGLASLEGLSMGKPTIAGLSDETLSAICDFWQINAGDIPWQIARNIETLVMLIGDLVLNHDWRKELGAKSRAFMEQIWSERNVALRLATIYESL